MSRFMLSTICNSGVVSRLRLVGFFVSIFSHCMGHHDFVSAELFLLLEVSVLQGLLMRRFLIVDDFRRQAKFSACSHGGFAVQAHHLSKFCLSSATHHAVSTI